MHAAVYFFNRSADSHRNHDFVNDKFGFIHRTDHIAGDHGVARLDSRFEIPFFIMVKGSDLNTSCDVASGLSFNHFQRSLDSVKDHFQDSRPQFGGKRFSRGHDFVAGLEAGGFLVYLDGSFVAPHFYNFTDQPQVTYADNVEHVGALHVFRNDQRTGYFYDLSMVHNFFTYFFLSY